MALVIKKIVDYYFYLNDEISGELKAFTIMLILFALFVEIVHASHSSLISHLRTKNDLAIYICVNKI